jgi:dipeptidase D
VNINDGLGHATKLLVRLLKGAEEPYGLRLGSLTGGTASNAIPREATAVACVQADRVDDFTTYVKNYETTIQAELAATEPEVNVQMDPADRPAQVMEQEFQKNLLNALYGTPQGVVRMSDAVPGMVETSTNLGIANIQDGQMELVSYPRSALDSELQDIEQMIISVWELAGFKAEVTDWFAAWTPDPDSPVMKSMQSAYQDLFGVEPAVSAIHAGLECGAIGGIYPDMDMISIGPTLEKVHSPSERLYIPSVGRLMELLTAFLNQVPEG